MSHDWAEGDRVLEDAEAEQGRLRAELDELLARTLAADEAQQRTTDRVRATFVELTAAARAELVAIDAEHVEAVAALRPDALARAAATGDQSEGP